MAKDKAAIVSGAGWIGGFVELLVREMLAQGWTPEAIHALVTQTQPMDQPIKAIVAGMRKGFPSSALAAQYGYTVVEEDGGPIADLDVAGLEYIPVLNPGEEPPVTGEVMRQRARERNANFSLLDGEKMLAKQDDIRADRNTYIVLAKTKLRGRSGNLYVACLFFSGELWYLRFFRLAYVWGRRGRFPRCK